MAITLSQAPSRSVVPFLTPPSFRRSSSRVMSFCGCRLGGPGSFFFVHGQRTRASASNTNYIFGVDVRACVLPIRKTVRATGVQQLSSEPLEGGETDPETAIKIVIDNEMDESCTSIDIISPNWPGILACVTLRFRDLELQVVKASVELKEGFVFHKFLVTDNRGLKPQDAKTLNMIEKGLHAALDPVLWPELTTDGKLTKGVGLVGNPELQRRRRLMWLMDQYLKNDVLSIQKSIVDHVEYTIARSRFKFDDFEAYKATANSVRDRLIESWNDNQQFHRDMDSKRVYYLSMEFLMGRSLLNSIFNLGIKEQYAQALNELGYNLEVVVEQERDAALGNGGLGRLAACFLDSLATMNYSAWGYGIRYQYGLFRQTLQDGFQHEQPDYWLNVGNPWEIERVHVTYPISFYGKVEEKWAEGTKTFTWTPDEMVEAVAYDNPIPGYNTGNTINLRLWAAKPSGEFDLGKELRLKQQYFFVSASLQDIMRRFKDHHSTFDNFADKVAVQLNDTHPTIGVPELMRLLVDVEGLQWAKAWDITTKVFSITIHSVVAETLEKWSVELLQTLLPRHLQIIFKINAMFLEEVKNKIGNDYDHLARLSIIEEGEKKSVKMGSLALVASHTVNGVSKLHSELLKERVFKVSIDAMFDVQVKRIHQYKRQLLNVLSIIHRADCIKNMSPAEKTKVVPRVCIIGGKAAPGYEIAKKIIKLVTTVGEKINNDKDIGNLLKVVFVPDYNVSLAELIIPASDLSQHISTAGNEASGTSNMKFTMNGCLLLATLSGSNIEIQKEIGDENIFVFGAKPEEVDRLRAERRQFQPPREFHRIIGMIRNGKFGDTEYFQELCQTVDGGNDFYLLGNDFSSYLEAQAAVDEAYVDRERWTRMSIMSTAGSGNFSIDRTTREYAENIWGIKPVDRF
ncbi:hypothetical protein CY35_02G018100 [Sphagnum magellanicum]|nr:hypothetical protein CY35_02G018100 [Sphagnum magellanicum]